MATCGKCKATSVSVAHVKQCYGLLPQECNFRDDYEPVYMERRTSRPVVTEQRGRNMPIRQVVQDAGMYQNPDTNVIYKVQSAIHGSGRLYAKRLVVDGNTNAVSFGYDRGAIKNLNARWRMTSEQAKEFGALYGSCMVCGRTLTNEASIEAGIGPVCAGKL